MRAPQGLIAELLSRRRWLLAGIVIATLATGSRFVSIGIVPPSLTIKQLRHATAVTQLLVGQRHTLGSAGVRQRYVTTAIPLAQTLADLMSSPAVRGLIARDAGIPRAQLAVDTPVWQDVVQVQQWPSREKRDSQLLVEGAAYRLTIDVEQTAPIIDVAAQAPTTQGAIALAAAAQTGLNSYEARLQATTRTPPADRYELTRLEPIAGSPGGRKNLANIAAFTFATVIFIWCGGMLFIANLAEDIRALRPRTKV